MSSDTSGIVAFGVAVEEEHTLPFPWPPEYDNDSREGDGHIHDDEWELGFHLARRQGIACPYDNLGPEYDPDSGWAMGCEPADWDKRTDAWYSAAMQAEKDAPIEIVWFCSYDRPMYIVALKGTKIMARCEEPQDLLLPTIDPGRIEGAALFCKANGILPFEQPKWLLCGYEHS
jgi:hypothetical protein